MNYARSRSDKKSRAVQFDWDNAINKRDAELIQWLENLADKYNGVVRLGSESGEGGLPWYADKGDSTYTGSAIPEGWMSLAKILREHITPNLGGSNVYIVLRWPHT